VNPESRENVEVTRTSIEIKNQNSNLVKKNIFTFIFLIIIQNWLDMAIANDIKRWVRKTTT
jgi:hypothetical protein